MQIYLEHFGLVEAPFKITPHTEFFFSGGNRGSTLEALLYAVLHDEGIVKVSGEVGSGKTMLCRVLMERLPANIRTIYLANPSLSRDDILYALADELGLMLAENVRSSVVLKALQDHLVNAHEQGEQVVVLIDEAHAMPAETLEEIRLLSNLESKRNKLLQLVLFGQPELDQILARADMRQLKERITHNFNLEPLIRDDIASYLDFRLRAAGYKGPPLFSREAVQAIARVSRGLTRRVNILADKALLAAYSAGTHAIGPAQVKAAVNDSDFSDAVAGGNARNYSRARDMLLVAAGAALLAGMLTWQIKPDIAKEHNSMPAAETTGTSESGLPIPAAPSSSTVPADSPHSRAPAKAANTPASIAPQQLEPRSSVYGNLTTKALNAGSQWVSDAPSNRWFLQLLLADGSQPEATESYLVSLREGGLDMTQVRVYEGTLRGTVRLGVIYGDYPSMQAAREAINQLPLSIRAANPFARPIRHLR